MPNDHRFTMEMACLNQKHHLLFLVLFTTISSTHVLSDSVGISSNRLYPFACSDSDQIQSCNSYLYHISKGHQIEEIATFYSVNSSSIKPIVHGTQHQQDYLVSVPCTCKDIKGTKTYLYDTSYLVKQGDTLENVVSEFYSGQAIIVGAEEKPFAGVGNMTTILLVCGCVEKSSQEVVTYTVQDHDTLIGIEQLLSAYESEIQNLNINFTQTPNFIDVGWVLFVPMELNGLQPKRRGSDFIVLFSIQIINANFLKLKHYKANQIFLFKPGKRLSLPTIIGVVSAVGFLFVATFIIFLLIRYRKGRNREEDQKSVVNPSAKKGFSLKQQFFKRQMEGQIKSQL